MAAADKGHDEMNCPLLEPEPESVLAKPAWWEPWEQRWLAKLLSSTWFYCGVQTALVVLSVANIPVQVEINRGQAGIRSATPLMWVRSVLFAASSLGACRVLSSARAAKEHLKTLVADRDNLEGEQGMGDTEKLRGPILLPARCTYCTATKSLVMWRLICGLSGLAGFVYNAQKTISTIEDADWCCWSVGSKLIHIANELIQAFYWSAAALWYPSLLLASRLCRDQIARVYNNIAPRKKSKDRACDPTNHEDWKAKVFEPVKVLATTYTDALIKGWGGGVEGITCMMWLIAAGFLTRVLDQHDSAHAGCIVYHHDQAFCEVSSFVGFAIFLFVPLLLIWDITSTSSCYKRLLVALNKSRGKYGREGHDNIAYVEAYLRGFNNGQGLGFVLPTTKSLVTTAAVKRSILAILGLMGPLYAYLVDLGKIDGGDGSTHM